MTHNVRFTTETAHVKESLHGHSIRWAVSIDDGDDDSFLTSETVYQKLLPFFRRYDKAVVVYEHDPIAKLFMWYGAFGHMPSVIMDSVPSGANLAKHMAHIVSLVFPEYRVSVSVQMTDSASWTYTIGRNNDTGAE